ncbi:MFS transporter [Erwinia sp. E602]|uniref:MFS transporter n=1 Tax=Erwinia sp. E602 TaxID=2675378 RepID=UPI001BA8413A|nr:MFS transporter [Erwinia sp. E602]
MKHEQGELIASEGNVRWSLSSTLAVVPLLIGAFLPPLDYFIVNLSLPAIHSDLSVSDESLQLIISVYACSYAVGLITAGRMGDRFGRKRLFLIGVFLFLLASLLCALATSSSVLIAGRLIQGISASIFAPQVLATIRASFDMRYQTVLTAFYGFIFGIAAITGQILGGVVVDNDIFGLGWRLIFMLNIPVGIVVLVMASLFVNESISVAERNDKIDFVGLILLVMLFLEVLIPISQGNIFRSLWSLTLLMMSIPTLFLLIKYEGSFSRNRGDALIDLKVFHNPVIAIGLLLAFLFYSDSAFIFTFGIYLQSGYQLSSTYSGLLFLPFALGFIIGPLLTPWLYNSLKNGILIFGYVIMLAGFGWLSFTTFSSPPSFVIQSMAIFLAGIGHGITLSVVNKVIIAEAKKDQAGLVSGLIICTLQVGSALGVALLGQVFFSNLRTTKLPGDFSYAFRTTLYSLEVVMIICIVMSIILCCLRRN